MSVYEEAENLIVSIKREVKLNDEEYERLEDFEALIDELKNK